LVAFEDGKAYFWPRPFVGGVFVVAHVLPPLGRGCDSR
jgi:hypothetical protein